MCGSSLKSQCPILLPKGLTFFTVFSSYFFAFLEGYLRQFLIRYQALHISYDEVLITKTSIVCQSKENLMSFDPS